MPDFFGQSKEEAEARQQIQKELTSEGYDPSSIVGIELLEEKMKDFKPSAPPPAAGKGPAAGTLLSPSRFEYSASPELYRPRPGRKIKPSPPPSKEHLEEVERSKEQYAEDVKQAKLQGKSVGEVIREREGAEQAARTPADWERIRKEDEKEHAEELRAMYPSMYPDPGAPTEEQLDDYKAELKETGLSEEEIELNVRNMERSREKRGEVLIRGVNAQEIFRGKYPSLKTALENNKNMELISLDSEDLSDGELDNSIWKYGHLKDVDCRNSNIQNLNAEYTIFEGRILFDGSNLTGSNFKGAQGVENCSFNGASLIGSDFRGTDLLPSDDIFIGADIANCKWGEAK